MNNNLKIHNSYPTLTKTSGGNVFFFFFFLRKGGGNVISSILVVMSSILGCVCFGWKSLPEMLFRIYGCLVAHGKCIFRKCFSIGLSTSVNWFPFLFYLQIPIFRKTERELSERETRLRAERERERGRTQKTQKSLTQIIVPDRVAPQNRSSSTQIVVPDCDLAFAPIAIVALISFARSRLSSNPVATRLWIFFFWVLFVFLDWGMKLYICLAAEKMWATSRKCVFYGIFNNTTKHQKIFFTIFSQIQPNTWKYFRSEERRVGKEC